tara:strand:+ start:2408 stop:3436 length:1029 start_codon:yes stop_codon:yes gene_type:complete
MAHTWDLEVADGKMDLVSQPRRASDLGVAKNPDEKQDPLEGKDHEVVVLVNNKNYRIFDNAGNLEIRNKAEGFGIHIGKNGDLMLLSGSSPQGTLGGRLCFNAHKGILTKVGGPIITEVVADSKNPVEGEGSKTSGESGKDELARSDVHYGDWITETHGELRLKATNIVIEATDVLSLVGGNSITMMAGPQGGGEITMAAGSINEVTSLKKTVTTSQKLNVGAAEETDLQYDPRASRNFISAGHMNVKAMGDFKMSTLGIGSVYFRGWPLPMPLIKSRRVGLNVGVGWLGGPININHKFDNINISTGLLSGLGDKTLPRGSVAIKASTLGHVKIKGLMIHLN